MAYEGIGVKDIFDFIGNNGFAVGIATVLVIYMMVSYDRRLGRITTSLSSIARSVVHTRKLLSLVASKVGVNYIESEDNRE